MLSFIIGHRTTRISEVFVDVTHLELLLDLLLKPPQLLFNVPIDVSESSFRVVEVQLLPLLICEGRYHLLIETLLLTEWISLQAACSLSLRAFLAAYFCCLGGQGRNHLLSTHLVARFVRLVHYTNWVEALDILDL